MRNRRSNVWIVGRFDAFLAVLLLVAAPLRGQSSAPGLLEGVVTDGVHARPLAAGRIVAVLVDREPKVSATGTTDELGQYQIDSLPEGRYMVEFTSSYLDSLGLRLAPRMVNVANGMASRADFVIPSGNALRAKYCPGMGLAKGTGSLSGRALDADTDTPLVGANVVVSWNELTVDRTTFRGLNDMRTAAATTDGAGLYRFCGLPTDSWLLVQLQHDGRSGAILRMLIPDSAGVVMRPLSISRSGSRSDTAAFVYNADSTGPAPLSGTAVLSGVVRGIGGTPLAGAQLRVLGTTASARSDASGAYTLRDLPPGTQVLEARGIGYLLEQMPVELRPARTITQDLSLRRIVNLDSIHVVAMRSKFREFDERRKHQAIGHFLAPYDIERAHWAVETSDLVGAGGAGFRSVGRGLNARVVSVHGASLLPDATMGGPCEVNVVVDRVEHQPINAVPLSNVGAMEFYAVGYPAPIEYDDRCGIIVIWTK
jgi:hypothetical protein